MFKTVAELVEVAETKDLSLSEVMILKETEDSDITKEEIMEKMGESLDVMEKAVQRGIEEGVRSHSGLTGGDAVLLQDYIKKGQTLSGTTLLDSVSKAVSTNEVNAAMGTICATPTAGSAGVVPGTLFGLKEKLQPNREQMIRYLLTSGAFGYVIANNSFVSGAAGGCQAEVGSATGMAAAAAVELAGGSPSQSAHAMSIALKNMLGLVCDPVAGLVEVPCVKRNAMGASNAIVAADMALAGITSRIPADEVIEAMYRVGQTMPTTLKETAQGGLAATPTGQELQAKIFGPSVKKGQGTS